MLCIIELVRTVLRPYVGRADALRIHELVVRKLPSNSCLAWLAEPSTCFTSPTLFCISLQWMKQLSGKRLVLRQPSIQLDLRVQQGRSPHRQQHLILLGSVVPITEHFKP